MDYLPMELEKRLSNIEVPDGLQYIDTIEITMPNHYKMNKEKSDFAFENEFGSYSFKVTYQDNQYLVIKRRIFKAGIYSSDSYENLRELLSAIKKQENKKWLFENKT